MAALGNDRVRFKLLFGFRPTKQIISKLHDLERVVGILSSLLLALDLLFIMHVVGDRGKLLLDQRRQAHSKDYNIYYFLGNKLAAMQIPGWTLPGTSR